MTPFNVRYHFLNSLFHLSTRCGPRIGDTLFNPVIRLAQRRLIRRKGAFMLENMRLGLPGKTEQEYVDILEQSVDHIWQFLLRNLFSKNSAANTRFVTNESLINEIVSGNEKGAVIITSHQGDWENLVQYFKGRTDFDTCNLYRKPNCKIADRFLHRFRGINQYCSGYGISKKFKQSNGKKIFALFGVDQKPFKKGVEVNFLNRRTSISPISVRIALKENIPVVVAKTLIRNGRTEISFRKISILPEICTSNSNTVQYALQQVMNQISEDITDHPGQWVMWSHNFWKKPKEVA